MAYMYGLQVWLTFLGRQRPLVEGKELSGGHFGDSLASICIQPICIQVRILVVFCQIVFFSPKKCLHFFIFIENFGEFFFQTGTDMQRYLGHNDFNCQSETRSA